MEGKLWTLLERDLVQQVRNLDFWSQENGLSDKDDSNLFERVRRMKSTRDFRLGTAPPPSNFSSVV